MPSNLAEARARLALIASGASGLKSDEDYQALDLVLRELGKCDDDREFDRGISKIKNEIDQRMRDHITELERRVKELGDGLERYRWLEEAIPERLTKALAIIQPLIDKNHTLDDTPSYEAVKTLMTIVTQFSIERIAIQANQGTLSCVFCGHVYPPGTPSSNHQLLSEHVLVCPDHPAAALRARLRELQASYDELSQISAWWIDPRLAQQLVLALEGSNVTLEELAATSQVATLLNNQIKINEAAIAAVKPTTSKLVEARTLLKRAQSAIENMRQGRFVSLHAEIDDFLNYEKTPDTQS